MNNRCNLCKCCNKTYEHTDMRDFDNKAHCTYLDTDITEFIIKDINIICPYYIDVYDNVDIDYDELPF